MLKNDIWFYDESCDSVPGEFGAIESEPDVELYSYKPKNKKLVEDAKVNSLPIFKSNTNDFGFKKGKPLRPLGKI